MIVTEAASSHGLKPIEAFDRYNMGKSTPVLRRMIRHVHLNLLRWLTNVPPHWVFAVIAGVNALLLTVLNPPFQVHDEFQHFLRAYQLSEGELWGVVQEELGGGILPVALPDFIERTWGTLRIHEIPPLGEHPLTETFSEFGRPLAPENRAFVYFSTVNYSPLPYFPQAIAIGIGRLFEAPPLLLLYMGRLLNATFAVAVISWSLRVLPVGRFLALVIALLPRFQYEYASVATDAAVISTAFLFTAVALRANVRNAWTLKDISILTIAGAIFCSIKPVLAPILLVGFSVRQFSTQRSSVHPALAYGAIVISVLAITIGWLALSAQGAIAQAQGTPQLTYVLQNPFDFALTLLRDLVYHGAFYIIDGIGILGAFTVRLPFYAYLIAGVCIILSCIYPHFDRNALRLSAAMWNWLLIASSVVLVQTALYLLATRVGFPLVFGVHGRYFMPLGALIAAALISTLWARYTPPKRPVVYAIVIILIALNSIVMDITIVREFALL